MKVTLKLMYALRRTINGLMRAVTAVMETLFQKMSFRAMKLLLIVLKVQMHLYLYLHTDALNEIEGKALNSENFEF